MFPVMYLSLICAESRFVRRFFLILRKKKSYLTWESKTLSLFFIDEVSKYRQYDVDGNEQLGEYGQMFEQGVSKHSGIFDRTGNHV